MCLLPISHVLGIYGSRREKTCLQVFANNTGVDQPVHSRSLISTLVIHFFGQYHI